MLSVWGTSSFFWPCLSVPTKIGKFIFFNFYYNCIFGFRISFRLHSLSFERHTLVVRSLHLRSYRASASTRYSLSRTDYVGDPILLPPATREGKTVCQTGTNSSLRATTDIIRRRCDIHIIMPYTSGEVTSQ